MSSIEKFNITFISRYTKDIEEYEKILGSYKNISFMEGDIRGIMDTGKYDTVVSPVNSFGFMSDAGTVDCAYINYFGKNLEHRIQNIIQVYCNGELLVGRSMIVPLNRSNNPQNMIVAPTMRCVGDVSDTLNSYYAFKAIIENITQLPEDTTVHNILVPCLAVGIGRMSPSQSAKQIKIALDAAMHTQETQNSDPCIVSIMDIHKFGYRTIEQNEKYMLSKI